MKPFAELTHYEVLELSPEAGLDDVERAYRMARSTFADDSLATYSVYDSSEAQFIQERIELAHQVLCDADRRSEYDAKIGKSEALPESIEITLDLAAEAAGRSAPEVEPEIAGFDDLEDPDDGPFDGARLRRARLVNGIEIDKIASVTKINPTYLRLLEEEEFRDLPAPVYVRGFVTAFARCVGLDPARFVPAYMQRLDAVQVSGSQGWRGRN